MRLKYILLLIVLFLSGCASNINVAQNINQSKPPDSVQQEIKPTSTPILDIQPEKKPEVEKKAEVGKVTKEIKISNTLDYPVPFVSQAPYAVWDDLHKEACEEAAIIMVAKYFNNEPLNAHTMEQAILSLVKWQQDNNYKVDLTASEARDIIISQFNLNAELITEVTIDRIKKELSEGKLIIIPAAGRKLGNPYFQTPGPIYHMLVIRGYDDYNFITNDVGTKRGEGFKYQYQKLIDAIHDWDHDLAEGGMTDDEIEQGRKVIIVVSK